MTYEEKAASVTACISLIGGAETLLQMAKSKCRDFDPKLTMKLLREQKKRLQRLLMIYEKRMNQ